MTSPFVRRRRLATELRTLREARGLTAGQLAQLIHHSRMKISRLENSKVRPEVAEVIKILDVLGVTGEKWTQVVRIACDAAERGWWDDYGDAMGARQRLHADIESGAATIRSYSSSTIPGLLQTSDTISALTELAAAEGPLGFLPEKMTEARLQRQGAVLRPDGPTCEFILDEVVIRRLSIPRETMASQLKHVVNVVSSRENVSVRVLPIDTFIEESPPPTAFFALYTFRDPQDSPMAVVETINTDIVHTDLEEVERYTRRYDHLSRAALSSGDSLALLREIAGRLTA